MAMSRRKKILIGVVAAPLLFAGAGAAAFGPVVRSKASDAAARYGAEVEIGWVSPRWDGLHLEDVRVRHPDAPSFNVTLADVRVSWSEPRTVEIDGGTVAVNGSPEAVLTEIERVRGRGEGGTNTTTTGGRTITAKNLAVQYTGPHGKTEARGVAISREGARVRVTAAGADVDLLGQSASVAGLVLEVERGDQPRLARLETAGLVLRTNRAAAAIPAAPAAAADTTSPTPAHKSRLRAPILRARGALESTSRVLREHLHPDAVVKLGGLSIEVMDGSKPLGLGPGTLSLVKEAEVLSVEYRADQGDPAAEGLVVRAPFPKPDDPLVVTVRGGPITLAQLGLEDGAFNLVDTADARIRANARVEVDPQAEVLRFSGDARVEGLSANLPAASKDTLRDGTASFRGTFRAALDGSHVEVQGGELELGAVRLNLSGTMSGDVESKKVDLAFEVPLVPCQALLDAAPKGLLPTLNGMRLAGSFALKGSLKFDRKELDKTYRLPYDIASTCRVTEAPKEGDVARFRKAFTHKAYAADGERRVDFETGPGTAAWTPYSSISRHVTTGVLGFEDGRFFGHEGFDHEAIRNSVRENIRKWRFVRGASTISMQLAKNLYLSRDKVLGRKIEELFLTMYLEQELTKEQMLELYLNIVEFGPGVYGIENGASSVFRTTPGQLSVSQAFYLASILPSPKTTHFGAGGSLSGGWLKLLRTVMKHSHKRHRLSDEELAQALTEIPLRGSSSPMIDPTAEVPAELLNPPPAEPGVPLAE